MSDIVDDLDCFMIEDNDDGVTVRRASAEITRLRALIGEMRQFAAHFLEPGVVPCAENFRNAQDRARVLVTNADEVLK